MPIAVRYLLKRGSCEGYHEAALQHPGQDDAPHYNTPDRPARFEAGGGA